MNDYYSYQCPHCSFNIMKQNVDEVRFARKIHDHFHSFKNFDVEKEIKMDNSLYVSPRQMADLLVNVVEQSGYFKADQAGHPEDIWIAMSTAGEAVSVALSWAIHKDRA